ncbi:MAG: ArsR/SmtB family transcription factor [Thermodesulfobacteriota bacterium]
MKDTVNILKALSDKNRLKIIYALMETDELCACQITEILKVKGATASRHLAVLASAGLLESRKEGRWVYYRINNDFFVKYNNELYQWIKNEKTNSEEFKIEHKKISHILKQDPEVICKKQRGVV